MMIKDVIPGFELYQPDAASRTPWRCSTASRGRLETRRR